MSTPQPVIKGAQAAQDAARAWQEVRADRTIQFEPIPVNPPKSAGQLPVDPPPASPPAESSHFLRDLFEPIGKALGLSWAVLQWVLIVIGVLIVLYLLFRMISPLLERRARAAEQEAEAQAAWVPDQQLARQLLDEADQLAAEGRFDEATHLLLRRTVTQIADVRPDWVHPASTAREIASIDGLADGARAAFGVIANRVERSLFALRRLGLEDWQAAREAYASFALAPLAAEGAR